MKSFTLTLQDTARTKVVEDVTRFVGEDASGSFGILADHQRMMTSLVVGMARFYIANQTWQYLALPGGILYFHDNNLFLSARRFLLDDNYEKITTLLQQQLMAEEDKLQGMKKSLYRLEEEAFKRLWKVGRQVEY